LKLGDEQTEGALMKLPAMLLGLLLSIAIVHSSSALTRIRDDMGGPLGRYLRMFAAMRDSGERVMIDGNCFSACTLVTAIIPKERICITERAVFGFHAGWVDRQKPVIYAEGTRLLYELYPPAIRRWINNHGGLGPRTILLKGRELAAFYPLCE
jgi:hypothetical protein